MRPLACHFLRRARYRPTWDVQNALAQRLREHAPDAQETLLAVEHVPVITIGRRGQIGDVLVPVDELARRGVDVVSVDRGGEVTYHGPGQLVLYPILRVDPARFGVGDLVRNLAGAVGDALAELGVQATYDPEAPGLWTGGAKICAVGMRVAQGVSTHGAAVNVTTALDAFQLIVPCGQPHASATSLARELARRETDAGPAPEVPSLDALGATIAAHFGRRLGLTPQHSPTPAWILDHLRRLEPPE